MGPPPIPILGLPSPSLALGGSGRARSSCGRSSWSCCVWFGVVKAEEVSVGSVAWGVKRVPVWSVELAKLFGGVGKESLEVTHVGRVDDVLWE